MALGPAAHSGEISRDDCNCGVSILKAYYSSPRSNRGARVVNTRLCLLFLLLSLLTAEAALADENLGGFQHLTTPAPPTRKSVVDLAPGLLTFFNNGPVFGIPGTELGNIWERTQLTGDWGGLRTDLARHGL